LSFYYYQKNLLTQKIKRKENKAKTPNSIVIVLFLPNHSINIAVKIKPGNSEKVVDIFYLIKLKYFD